MKRWLFIAFALHVAACRLAAAPAPDDDRAKAVATLDKALKALGGEEKLAQLTSFIVKSREKSFQSDGTVSEQVTTHWYKFPDYRRIEIKNGKDEIVWTQVLAGDRGWNVSDGTAEEMNKKDLAQSKEYYFLRFGVRDLPSFKGAGCKLAWLGESKVEKQAIVGIRVSHVGSSDVSYFFHQDTGLLLKRESMLLMPTAADATAPQEMKLVLLYKDYKEACGVKYPSKITTFHDDKKTVEDEVTEFKVVEKFDEKTFAKPE